MEKDNIFKEEKKILDKDAKDPKIAKTELNDDELDEVLGLSSMGLSYEAHVAGFDGECFDFCVYFGSSVTDEEACAVENAVHEFLEPYEEKDIYLGYVDITS